jgi:streptogramin lyase
MQKERCFIVRSYIPRCNLVLLIFLFLALFPFAKSASAGTVQLSQAGQKQFYDSHGNVAATISTSLASDSSNILLFEDFENGTLDPRIAVETVGTFNSNPGIKDITNFGSTKAFGFGRTTCGASCFNGDVTDFKITFPSPTYVSTLSFKEIELYGNWGSGGKIYIDGNPLTPEGNPPPFSFDFDPSTLDFGRIPYNDLQADTTYQTHTFTINRTVSVIEMKVGDITSASEIFIDDLLIMGGSSPQTGLLSIKEFVIPTSNGGPIGITSGPDGNVWFAEQDGNKIGRITTSGVITEFSLPAAGSSPQRITAGPDGTLWFTERSGNRIGRITTNGLITEFTVPTADSEPWGITAGPDGNLWFTEWTGNQIGRMTTEGVVTEFSIPTPGSSPFEITTGPDGNLWFTEASGGVDKIGRITTTGVITEFAVPTGNSWPNGIAAGPDGNIWFTEANANKIGRITATGGVTEFAVGLYPINIVSGSDGNLWITEMDGNKIARMTTAGVITELDIPTTGSNPWDVASGPDGNIWFSEYSGNKIGQIVTRGTYPQTLFYDDFESYTLGSFPTSGGWQLIYDGVGDSSQYVDSSHSVSGGQSLHLVGSTGSPAGAFHPVGIGDLSHVRLEAEVFVGQISKCNIQQALAAFNLRDVQTTATFGGVRFNCDGEIYAVEDNVANVIVPIMSYKPQTWYDIILDVDLTAKSFDVYINGALSRSGVLILNSGTPTGVFLAAGYGADLTVWFDDVRVSSSEALSGAMQVPDGQTAFPPYVPAAAPVINSDPSQAKPIGVGSVASAGDTLSLQVGLPQFSGPVDVYFGIFAPSIDPNNVYLLKSDDTLQPLSGGLLPWQSNISGNINDSLFGNIPISSLPPGTYTFYLVVAPAGSLNSFYLWSTSITVGGSIGANAPYISALVLKKTGASDLLRATVCTDSSCGTPITDAIITVNGTPLLYNGTHYEATTGVPAAGQAVNLSVIIPSGDGVAQGTYTATGTQYSDFPTVASPTSGAIWDPAVNNTVNWTPGVPSAGAQYHVAIKDGKGHFYPSFAQGSVPAEVPITSTSYPVTANTIPAGTYSVTVGIETASPIAISGAASGSGLYIGGVSAAQTLTVQGGGEGVGNGGSLNWTTQISGTSNDLLGITWSGSTFVAVGWNGTIMTSPDGASWTTRISGTWNGLYDVTWSGSQFVAVGYDGAILTSPDGVLWTTQASGTSETLVSVTCSGSKCVAVGGGGIILMSPDGVNWTPQSSGMTGALSSITWSGSQFVAVGIYGTILISPDGVNWATRASMTSNDVRSITWWGSQFLAVGLNGTIQTSPDGVNWTTQVSGTSYDLSSVAWSGSQFVMVGNGGTILTSPDGVNWTHRVSGTSYNLSSVAWSGSRFVAAGVAGTILTSPDGVNWTIQASITSALDGVTWSGSQFVAVGDNGTILTSPDGVNWTPQSSGAPVRQASGTADTLSAIAWSGSKFVAVGGSVIDEGSFLLYYGTILTSPDGVIWTTQQEPLGSYELNGITWSGSKFVAVGIDGIILTSPDGVNWTPQASGTSETLYGVTWSGSQFVAVGNSGIILTSPNGANWTIRAWGSPLLDVIWSGSKFVAVGDNGIILTSPDGVNWTPQTSGTPNGLLGITWSGSKFVAVGDNGMAVGGSGTILTSPDGVNWTPQTSGTPNGLLGITWSGSKFVAVGDNGTILTSP